MASINDLATAATIASSAVVLQSSPTQEPTQSQSQSAQSTSTSPPQSPSATTAATTQSQSQSQSQATTMANEDGDSITVATGLPPSPQPTITAAAVAVAATPSVLAAPRIDPSQAQIPAPPVSAPATDDVASGDAIDDKTAGASSTPAATGTGNADSMDGVQEPPVRGAFVVFEGMDRAGKTTQAKLLQQRCVESGRDVRFMRFPDRTTPIGEMIDRYLRGETVIEDHVIHLLFSANRWEAVKKIQAELDAGHTIICDRFYHSGIVYSAAKNLKSLSLSWAKAPEVGLPRPDMVLFLDLEEEVARERGGWGGEVYEKGEMQRRVRELFWGLSMGDLGSAAANNSSKAPRKEGESRLGNGVGGGRGDGGSSEEGEFRQEEEDIQIVDADLGVEELSGKVWELVLPRLEAVERGEVGRTVRTVR